MNRSIHGARQPRYAEDDVALEVSVPGFSLPLPLSLTLQLSALPQPDNPLLLAAPPAQAAQHEPLPLLLTDLVISAGTAASPYRIDPDPRLRSGWTCHGVDNATLDVAARCPLSGLTQRLPR